MKILEKVKEIAIAFDKEAFPGRTLHLSFLVYKKRIIAIGQNSKKTHPINLKNPKIKNGLDISGFRGSCSEWSALRTLKNLTNILASKCTLVNVRINKQNGFGASHPCSSCLLLLSFFGVKNVYYTNKRGEFEKFKV